PRRSAPRLPCGTESRTAWRKDNKGTRWREGGRAAMGTLSGLGQQLLEQPKGARVVGLAEPEQGLAPDATLRVRAGDPDECRHTGVPRLLGQGEHRLLFHVPIDVAVVDQVGETAGRGVSRGLAEPEHRLMAGAPRRVVVTGELQEQRPDDHRVSERGG